MAVCHLPAPAARCVRVRLGVTSDGMGGTVPLGDESGGVMVALGYGRGTADSGMMSSFRRCGQGAAPLSATAGLPDKPERCDGRREVTGADAKPAPSKVRLATGG